MIEHEGGRRLRVAFLSHHFGEYSVRLASALAHVADVQLLVPRALLEPFAGLADPALSVVAFEKPRLRQPVAQLRSVREITGRIRAFRPDVLHLQHGHLWGNLALPILRSIPLVVTVHDARHHPGDAESARTPQWAMDAGYRAASDLIVHAETVGATVRERFGRSADTVHLMPHIAIGGREDAPPRDEDPTSVLFFGRIWPYKGLEYLVRAEPLVTAAVPDARFVIAGRGEDLDRYLGMMVHPERFEVRNAFISEDDRVELFQRAALVVLPYLEASQSGVVPVAYAFAKPVVATTVGGLPEAVDDGVTGLLVPPADEGALAAAIVRLLRDPDLRHRMGAAGLRKLEEECGPEVVAAQTLAVYERAVARRGARRAAAR